MASIRREVLIDALPETAWDALRDVGALHTRLVPGFVTDTQLEEGARVVTFGNGMVARELIVSIDDEQRRVSYSVVGGRPTHHHASMQVAADGERRTRFVWFTDFLPEELGDYLRSMMDMGTEAMRKTLERRG